MKIDKTEVVNKITREILNLFKIKIEVENEIEHEIKNGEVITKLSMNGEFFIERDKIKLNELERAEIHRLVKKNLYVIFKEQLKINPSPYGIMHGVRPTKIVHRWLRSGEKNIIERLQSEYLVSEEKARLLNEVALKQLPILKQSDEQTISIYIGIPFCVTRCLYCSFPSNILPSEKKIVEFMNALKKDIESAKKLVEKYKFKVQSIYVGGGTPSSLPNIFFAEMLNKVYNEFYSDSVQEFTVECGRPDTINEQKIMNMKECQVNRVSVNPQTMNQKTLNIIGRRHSPEDIIRAFNDLHRMNNWKINMDLILGLPKETIEDVVDSVEEVLKLQPNDVTIHALALKRGSRLQMNIDDEVNKLSDFELPSDEEVREMAKVVEKMLREKNYQPYYLYRQGYMSGQIENVGYSQEGSECIYNVQIMDERQTIIGIGGAATTKVVDFKNKCLKSTFNAKDLITYIRDIDYYIDRRDKLIKEIYGE